MRPEMALPDRRSHRGTTSPCRRCERGQSGPVLRRRTDGEAADAPDGRRFYLSGWPAADDELVDVREREAGGRGERTVSFEDEEQVRTMMGTSRILGLLGVGERRAVRCAAH